MFSKSKNVGGSEEEENSWDELAALRYEELELLNMEMEHRIPAPCNEVYMPWPRRLQLRFLTRIFSPVLTRNIIKGEGCEFVKVGLFDSLTGKEIVSGPEASAEVEIVVLEEDFGSISDDDWRPEEFDKRVVTVWKRKKSLLTGTKKLNLKQGIAILDDISFTHDKHWVAKSKFRLGAKIVNNLSRVKVREAKTEPFELNDFRLECYRKHSIPSLLDDVWRLKMIARNRIPYKSLRKANIKTVKDFLILLFLNPRKLREIYGGSSKNWNATVRHAQTCTDKMVCYSSSSRQQSGVVVNALGDVLGLLSEEKFVHVDKLSEAEKASAHKSVKLAFEQGENVDCFDNEKDVRHGSPHLSNASDPSNFPSGCNFETDYDHMFSSCNVELNGMGDEDLISCFLNGQLDVDESYQVNNPEYPMGDFRYDPNEWSCARAEAQSAQRRWERLSRVWFKMWIFVKMMGTASVRGKKLRLCY